MESDSGGGHVRQGEVKGQGRGPCHTGKQPVPPQQLLLLLLLLPLGPSGKGMVW
jgi:hypothetical protein